MEQSKTTFVISGAAPGDDPGTTLGAGSNDSSRSAGWSPVYQVNACITWMTETFVRKFGSACAAVNCCHDAVF